MNLLIEPLPTTVKILGQDYPINSAFYIGVEFEILMQNPDLSEQEKAAEALSLYYPKIPYDTEGAIDALLWFYRCGVEAPKSNNKEAANRQRPKKAYCFEQDCDLIYAAFWANYHIDLAESDLHWWKFRALFRGLPLDCEIVKIMGYRTADLNGLDKATKKHYEKMRKLYAIKNLRSVDTSLSLAERDQKMMEYVSKRFEEAGGSN